MKKAILLLLLLAVNLVSAQLGCDKPASVGALKACKVDVQRTTTTDTLTADIINTDTIHKLDVLTDISSIRSIRVNNRQLMNNAGNRTMIDWQNGYLQYPATNTISVDWITGELWGTGFIRSQNWINRTLFNSNGNVALNYSSSTNGIGISNVGSASSAFLKNSFLTANRTYNFPDSSGRLALTISNVASASKLEVPRTINGVAFDGTADITLSNLYTSVGEHTGDFENGVLKDYSNVVSISWLANGRDRELVTTSDVTALKWQNGVGINSQVSAKYANLKTTNLTADRDFEFPNTAGTIALTSSNVASATALQTARKINGKNFDGTAAITIPTVPANSIVIIGDSWSGLHKGGVAPGVTTPNHGFFNIANTRMNKKFHVLHYAGVSGERTDQISARFQTEVIALSPGYVLIQGGINDINQSVSATTIFTNLQGMYDLAVANGIQPIVLTVPLCPVFGTSTLRNVAHQVNAMLKQDIRSKGNIKLIDINTVLVDQSTGLVSTTYVGADNTHLTNLGAGVLGDYIYQVLDPAIPTQIDMLPSSSNDNYSNFSAGGNYTNLLPNGMLTGNTSGLATNWATNVTLSVGGSGVLNTDFEQSKVSAFSAANRKYRNFEWQQLKAIGSSSTEKRFAFRVSSVSSVTGFNTGDYYYAECEFESDDDWVNVTRMSLELVSTTASFTPSTASIDLFNDTSYGTHTGSTTPQYNVKSGTLRTYPIQIASGRDRLYSEFKFYAGNGTVRVARMAIKKAIPYTIGGVTYFLY